MTPELARVEPSSFRDPSGFVFRDGAGDIFRQVNPVYEAHYRRLMDSGLYRELIAARLLVSHEELSGGGEGVPRCIRPEQIGFISYPYEWSFSQLKDAALLTLDVQRRALQHGMSLKDASAYNVVFHRGRPLFIDTLSFATRESGRPWVAYGQFCAHFLAPLALMSMTDIRLQRLLESFIDGVPLDLAARLLPRRARFRPGLLVHLFVHAWMQRRHGDTGGAHAASKAPARRVSEVGLAGMVDGLRRLVGRLEWKPEGSEWVDYYATNSYDQVGLAQKERIVAGFVARAAPRTVWDLGANTGVFSRVAAAQGADTVACDVDPACVEVLYREVRRRGEEKLLPLRIDLTNPSAAIGWALEERASLISRGPVDLVMMLALLHHLAIANNVPLGRVARFARSLGRWLIIEFVPKGDPQVQRLLRSRADIFTDYTQEAFEAAFGECYAVVAAHPVGSDGRVLYLLEGRS